MSLGTATLPDGRRVACVNSYEVDFSVHEIFSEDLARHGLDLPPDGTFLDVGANIGLFAFYLRDRAPAGRIFAYEPMPAVFEALEDNLAALDPPGRGFRLALGAEPGRLEFDYFPGVSALSTANHEVGQKLADGLKQLLGGQRSSEEVKEIVARSGAGDRATDDAFLDELFRAERVTAEVDTLSNQIAAHGLETVDLLKVDTEGAELEVLAGLAEADWPKVRQLLVEVHLGKEATDELAETLRGRGYRTALGSHPLSQGGAAVYHVYATRGPARASGAG